MDRHVDTRENERERKRQKRERERAAISSARNEHDFLKKARKNERHAEEVPGSPVGSDWSVTGQSS